jgi:hypothetical protein
MFITAFTRVFHLSLSWARPAHILSLRPFIKRICPSSSLVWMLRPWLFIPYIRSYPPQLEAFPLSATWRRPMQNYDINITSISFENMAQLRYLGTTVTNQNLIQDKIKRRLNSVWRLLQFALEFVFLLGSSFENLMPKLMRRTFWPKRLKKAAHWGPS